LYQAAGNKGKYNQAQYYRKQIYAAYQRRIIIDDLEKDSQVKVANKNAAEGKELRQ